MIDLSKGQNYFVACGYMDLRLGINGLAAVVTQQFGGQLTEESIFLFCGGRTDRIKALHWSGDGLNVITLIEDDVLDKGNLIPLLAEARTLFQQDWIAQKFLGSTLFAVSVRKSDNKWKRFRIIYNPEIKRI